MKLQRRKPSRQHGMSGLQHRLALAAAGGIVVMAASLHAQSPEPGRDYPMRNWTFVGGDWSGSRHSSLTEITPATIDRLGAAWFTRLEGASSRATPVVEDGMLYLTAGMNVLALDAETGATVWRWQPESSTAGMVPSWQGVGLGDGLVFVGLRSAQVAALRQESGDLVWITSVGRGPDAIGERVTAHSVKKARRFAEMLLAHCDLAPLTQTAMT